MKKKVLQIKSNLKTVLVFAIMMAGLTVANAQSFSLIGPPDQTALTVEGNAANMIDITWNSDTLVSNSYTWVLLDASNATVVSLPSNNSGADTMLTLTYGAIDGLFQSLGVTLNTTLPLKWYVSSTDLTTTNSSDTFDITLTRGSVSSPFNLISPSNSALLNVAGNGSNQIDIIWENSGEGVTYAWWLDVAGGNFTNPIIVVPSNNSGADTVLTLDFATIDAVLGSAGVMLGDTANLQWAVSAFAGNDTLISTNVNTIDLVRGAVANTFDLVGPPNGLVAEIAGLASTQVDITWENSGNGVTYAWWLDVAGGNFTNPIIVVPSNNMGIDTALTLDFATIDAVLGSAGVMLGDTANLQWAVSAFAGNDTLISTSVNTINLVRGAISNPFNLTSPGTGALLTVEGNGSNQIDITWENAGNGVTYAWWLDVAGGNFTNPIIVVPSNNMGMDTALTLDFATIDAVLGSAGVMLGDTANLQWAVSAFAGNDTLISTNVNTIDLVRGAISNPFDLIDPPTGFAATISGLGSNQVDITWENAGDGVTYAWWLDVAGGTFTNPIIVVPSNNSGADTVLTLDFATIDAVLAGAGVNVGATANLQWAVSAFAGNDTLISTSVNTIDLTRGNIFDAFSLLSPANNATLDVEGLAQTTVDITWSASSANANYTWLLDVPAGDFSNPIVAVSSNNSGADTTLTLDFATIDAVLAGAGVNVGSSANLKWTVTSNIGTDTVFATQDFNITLNRNGLLPGFNLLTPADGATYTNEGLGTQEVVITWSELDPAATYTWALFSGTTLVVAIPTGTDTSLILDYATIDAVLASVGVQVGNTAQLSWDVLADLNGTNVFPNNLPFSLGIVRGTVINEFDLLTPPDGFSATIQGDPTQTVEITWNSSSQGNATYKWMLDVQGGDFSNPIIVVPSGNSGADTSLVLDFATIASVLSGAGVTPGNSVDLIWTVKVNGGGDSLSAAEFDLNLTRGVITSTREIENAINQILVYPNPVKDNLFISGIELNSDFEFSILDVTGKVVKSGLNFSANGNQIISVSDLNNGFYLLSLTNGETTTVRRITVAH